MTSTNTLDPANTGEIELGGETARLSDYQRSLPPTQGLRRPDATGEIVMPRSLDLGPVEQDDRPAVMPTLGNDAQLIFPLERVLTGDDLVDTAPDAYVGRHRAPDDMPTRLHRGPSLHARFVAWLRPAAKR